jgi:hypothetical protein
VALVVVVTTQAQVAQVIHQAQAHHRATLVAQGSLVVVLPIMVVVVVAHQQ